MLMRDVAPTEPYAMSSVASMTAVLGFNGRAGGVAAGRAAGAVEDAILRAVQAFYGLHQ